MLHHFMKRFFVVFCSFIPESSLASAPSHRPPPPSCYPEADSWTESKEQHRSLELRHLPTAVPPAVPAEIPKLTHLHKSHEQVQSPPHLSTYHCVSVQTGVSPHLSCSSDISRIKSAVYTTISEGSI